VAPVTNSTPADSIYLPTTMQYFSITCMFPTATAYTITATGLPAQGMDGFVYTIDEANVHRTTGLPTGWVGVGSTCWVTNRSGACRHAAWMLPAVLHTRKRHHVSSKVQRRSTCL